MDLKALSTAVDIAWQQGSECIVIEELKRQGWRHVFPPLDELRAVILASVIEDANGCWIWQRLLDRGGYGQLYNRRAHRVAYETWVGPIPHGLVLDHLCCVRACCNPIGLERFGVSLAVFLGWTHRHPGLLVAQREHVPPLLWSVPELDLLLTCWTSVAWRRDSR